CAHGHGTRSTRVHDPDVKIGNIRETRWIYHKDPLPAVHRTAFRPAIIYLPGQGLPLYDRVDPCAPTRGGSKTWYCSCEELRKAKAEFVSSAFSFDAIRPCTSPPVSHE